jgi:hypothetical protein
VVKPDGVRAGPRGCDPRLGRGGRLLRRASRGDAPDARSRARFLRPPRGHARVPRRVRAPRLRPRRRRGPEQGGRRPRVAGSRRPVRSHPRARDAPLQPPRAPRRGYPPERRPRERDGARRGARARAHLPDRAAPLARAEGVPPGDARPPGPRRGARRALPRAARGPVRVDGALVRHRAAAEPAHGQRALAHARARPRGRAGGGRERGVPRPSRPRPRHVPGHVELPQVPGSRPRLRRGRGRRRGPPRDPRGT